MLVFPLYLVWDRRTVMFQLSAFYCEGLERIPTQVHIHLPVFADGVLAAGSRVLLGKCGTCYEVRECAQTTFGHLVRFRLLGRQVLGQISASCSEVTLQLISHCGTFSS